MSFWPKFVPHLALAAALLLGTPLANFGAAAAQDIRAGREKAASCVPCHGLDGIAKAPDAPNLAGDSRFYVDAQLKAFRGGQRQHPQMTLIAQSLSDEDIADLAAWYSAIKISAKLPQD